MEVSLEDLAMGVMPKTNKKGEKPEVVADKVKAGVKQMANLALKQEGMSVKALKKFNKTELKMMMKAADKLQDSLYRTKEMIREAMPKDNSGMKGGYPMTEDCC